MVVQCPCCNGDIPAHASDTIEKFLKQAREGDEQAYVNVVEEMGPAKSAVILHVLQLQMTSRWSAVTDHPFPSELIDSPILSTKLINLSKVEKVITEGLKLRAMMSRERIGRTMIPLLTQAIRGSDQTQAKDVSSSSTATSEGESAPAPAPQSFFSPMAPDSGILINPTSDNFDLVERPITKSYPCQEKVFKKLSGDNRQILKCGRVAAKQSKESFLLCTIVGFRKKECAFVEPVGTCGMYENEARFLVVDSKSTMKNGEDFRFLDMPIARDIRVYDVERIIEGERWCSDVMSLLHGKPVWRVKSFSLVEVSSSEPFESIMVVEKLHPAEHAVVVRGPWFPMLRYLHMGSMEMPPLHSFLKCVVRDEGDYDLDPLLTQGTVIYVKHTLISEKLCRFCGKKVARETYTSQLRLVSDEEVVKTNAQRREARQMDLAESTRLFWETADSRTCFRCLGKTPHLIEHGKKSRTRESGRKQKVEVSSRTQLVEKSKKKGDSGDRSSLHSTHSDELEVLATVSEGVKETVSPTATLVVKPDPIRCNLCLTDIQPMEEVYFKLTCLEDCHLFCHKKCLQDSLAGQGLRKKREYKDGNCPTEGCSAPIHDIYEYSITNEESLYLKCVEKPRNGKNSAENVPREDKKKDLKSKVKDRQVEPQLATVPNDVQDGKENVPVVDVPPPPPSSLPVVAADRPLVPPPKPHLSIPLPVDIENVVPLVKEKDLMEAKYAVSEQPQKKMKVPNKKKVVLDIPIGLPREKKQSTRDVTELEVPVQRGIGRGRSKRHDRRTEGGRQEVVVQNVIGQGRSQCQERRTLDDLEQWSPRDVDFYLHECKICLEAIGTGDEEVLWCPVCDEPYHSQCIRTWLSTNSTCPQCRRNWPDPVDFPGLGGH